MGYLKIWQEGGLIALNIYIINFKGESRPQRVNPNKLRTKEKVSIRKEV